MEESGEGSPAREHVVDRLGDRGMAREFGALCAHRVFQPGDQGVALFAPRVQPLLIGQSIDLALDVKERVDAFDGLQAIGEIGGAFLPRGALAAMSANSKNLRRAWLQHRASRIGPGLRSGR